MPSCSATAYDAVLRESGHSILAEGLPPVQTARPCASGKARYTTDCPFAETKERLGGFFSQRPGLGRRHPRGLQDPGSALWAASRYGRSGRSSSRVGGQPLDPLTQNQRSMPSRLHAG